nr:hypothetical protein Iba_chr13dCG4040 [Ipomoea batatas]
MGRFIGLCDAGLDGGVHLRVVGPGGEGVAAGALAAPGHGARPAHPFYFCGGAAEPWPGGTSRRPGRGLAPPPPAGGCCRGSKRGVLCVGQGGHAVCVDHVAQGVRTLTARGHGAPGGNGRKGDRKYWFGPSRRGISTLPEAEDTGSRAQGSQPSATEPPNGRQDIICPSPFPDRHARRGDTYSGTLWKERAKVVYRPDGTFGGSLEILENYPYGAAEPAWPIRKKPKARREMEITVRIHHSQRRWRPPYRDLTAKAHGMIPPGSSGLIKEPVCRVGSARWQSAGAGGRRREDTLATSHPANAEGSELDGRNLPYSDPCISRCPK